MFGDSKWLVARAGGIWWEGGQVEGDETGFQG